jgi:hypothetical protein
VTTYNELDILVEEGLVIFDKIILILDVGWIDDDRQAVEKFRYKGVMAV